MAPRVLALVSPGAYLVGVGLGVALIAAAVRAARRAPERAGPLIADAIGVLLLADVVSYVCSSIDEGDFAWATSLPLALCNAAVVVAAIACFTRTPTLAELTWFVGLAGCLQAVVTPDLSAPFPKLQFFEYLVGHLGVIAAAVVLVIGLGLSPRRNAPLRCFLAVAGYTALVAAVDWLTGANYMFLRRAPGEATLLSALGPYPEALLAAAGVAFGLFVLLDFPFFLQRRQLSLGWALHGFLAWALTVTVGLVVWPLTQLVGPRRRLPLLVAAERLLCAALRIRVEVKGPALPEDPCVIVANHGSFLDGPILASTLRRPSCFVVTAALGRQRVAGPYLRALGTEFVGPVGGRSVREQLRGLGERLAAGEDLVGFPEGGIAHGGGALSRFHLGLFLVAAGAGAPVVPVAIRGSASLLPPGRRLVRGGRVTVVYGPAIPSEGGGLAGARDLAGRAHATLSALLSGEGEGAPVAALH